MNGTGGGGGNGSSLAVSASGTPSSGSVPLTVSFTGGAKGGSPPYSYAWQFGDGQGASLQDPSHTYQGQGTFLATLQVTDSAGNSAWAYVTSVVSGGGCGNCSAPGSTLSGTAAVLVGDHADFTATLPASSGTYHLFWSFGDGTTLAVVLDAGTSSQLAVQHTYHSPGLLHVSLLVNGVQKNPSSASLVVHVSSPAASQSGNTSWMGWALPTTAIVVTAAVLLTIALRSRGKRKVRNLSRSNTMTAPGEVLDPYSAYRPTYVPLPPSGPAAPPPHSSPGWVAAPRPDRVMRGELA